MTRQVKYTVLLDPTDLVTVVYTCIDQYARKVASETGQSFTDVLRSISADFLRHGFFDKCLRSKVSTAGTTESTILFTVNHVELTRLLASRTGVVVGLHV